MINLKDCSTLLSIIPAVVQIENLLNGKVSERFIDGV